MQSIQALEIRISQESPVRCEVTVDRLKGMASEAACGEPLALVLVDAELDAFANEAGSLIVKRSKKHPAKPLSGYFSKRVGIVAVNADYTVAGQALRGIRAFLRSIGDKRRQALNLVGIPRSTFDELSERAAAPAHAPHAETGERDSVQRLEAMLSAGEPGLVPVGLCRAFVGTSPAADVIRRLILCAARNDIPVLIEGESGTGKEIVARQIHQHSARAGQFIVVNCGGIAPDLFESELFGHEKGAFTGATSKKEGLWTLASKGTLFLDEIGDLPLEHQVKILRALDKSGYYAVGATTESSSEARIIAATNRDLAAMVRLGTFREDLYYRLFSFRIRTYPLRQHREDIPLLAQHFWRKVREPSHAPDLSEAALNELKGWDWPGNARELRSLLANTFAFAGERPVTAELIRNVIVDRLGPQVATLSQDS